MVFSRYERHNAKIREKLLELLSDLRAEIGDFGVYFHITGSIGMGVAERCALAFTQEVVAATNFIRHMYPETSTMIDIGGEDAKVVFFENGETIDLRMNGNCAGGTGAFIDQMAILMGAEVEDLDEWASKAERHYSIASRCGVFSKTDIQNLIAKNICKEDIAASVFHAVAVQVNVTLAHGCDMRPPLLFCGGPLSFIKSLRAAFIEYMHITEDDIILPKDSHLIPAYGAALAGRSEENLAPITLSELIKRIDESMSADFRLRKGLEPIFKGDEDYKEWSERISQNRIKVGELKPGRVELFLGIDSGSTTTKIVLINRENEILFSHYCANRGNPVAAVAEGLDLFAKRCEEVGTEALIVGSCSTGYGEDLIKAAFRLDSGIVETIAHYLAARHIAGEVSFILDIGGQDMKALFVSNGVIDRMEINEACSSGCGSFIETFAKSLDLSVEEFAREACKATTPYDLGTRCTVFMNSKVKQALREGAPISDIAAGLSYSVVKNCLYKVLRLKNVDELGDHIVLQGGTMKNDSVVRAFEILVGKRVFRSNHPELMGAMGCALYARERVLAAEATQTTGASKAYETATTTVTTPAEMTQRSDYTVTYRQCSGCENRCEIAVYLFGNGNRYFSGNRCEKIFTNQGSKQKHGVNLYTEKLKLLFDREITVNSPRLVIGIPRCLNMFEEYPFWHTLFSNAGIKVVLSSPSTFEKYELKVNLVMSDNICFPAKLAHSHIEDLRKRGVDRIFMPFVVFERLEGGQNSYNCPVVSGYSEVIRSVQSDTIPVDSPAITFKDEKALYTQCYDYLKGFGVKEPQFRRAFRRALREQRRFENEIAERNVELLKESEEKGRLAILLAGRPYHADPLVQHKLSDIVEAMGVDVITDDIVRNMDIPSDDAYFVPQWAYTNRILKAVKFAAMKGSGVQCMQMTSFGCGPDAFLTDETRNVLHRYGKTLTLLKMDDIGNIGSAKLRVRSFIDSLKLSDGKREEANVEAFHETPIFGEADRGRKIIVPFFTPFISPLAPALFRLAGYDMDSLPGSDLASCDWGLKYANNEVCYPATLVVGDIVKAFVDGKYDPEKTAVAITQTGGQCRASNYISLIKKALAESGYGNVPVISISFGSGLHNEQPGFKMNWFKYMPLIVTTLLYSDCIAKFYYASVVREKKRGVAEELKDKYLNLAVEAIGENSSKRLLSLLKEAAEEFNSIVIEKKTGKVGIVGEIYLKFNPFAQKNIGNWLIEQGVEVIPPMLTDFFVQSFVNFEVNRSSSLRKNSTPAFLMRWLYRRLQRYVAKVNGIASSFKYYTPFADIFAQAKEASRVISLYAQFGEGWLLPGEIMSMASHGVNHVVSLQPFGCIANHIVSKGIEKRIRQIYPTMHILSLDFDSGVSDVNITNRLLLFMDSLKG